MQCALPKDFAKHLFSVYDILAFYNFKYLHTFSETVKKKSRDKIRIPFNLIYFLFIIFFMRSKLDKETLHDVYINSIYIKAGKTKVSTLILMNHSGMVERSNFDLLQIV